MREIFIDILAVFFITCVVIISISVGSITLFFVLYGVGEKYDEAECDRRIKEYWDKDYPGGWEGHQEKNRRLFERTEALLKDA
jgi:hypothetical protein